MIKDRERAVMTAAEREVCKTFGAVEAKQTMSDYAKSQKVLHENRERLKTERLARETDALKAKQ